MTSVKVIILIVIIGLGIFSAVKESLERRYGGIILAVLGTIALGILTEYLTDVIKPFLPYPDSSVVASASAGDTKETNFLPGLTDTKGNGEGKHKADHTDHVTKPAEPAESDELTESDEPAEPDNTVEPGAGANSIDTGGTGTAPPPEENNPTQAVNVLGAGDISGRLAQEKQKDEYVCAAPIEGTYRVFSQI